MEWYRVYHGMPHDPKLKVIAHRAKQPMAHVVAVWTCLLDAASQHRSRGTVEVDAEQIAIMQDIETEAVQAIIAAMYTKGMLDEQNRLTAWDKRQHTTSAERMARHRDKKKRDVTASDAAAKKVTVGDAKKRKNAPDTDNRLQTTDSDTESQKAEAESQKNKKTDSNTKNRARAEGEREREKTKTLPDEIAEQMLQIWNAEVQSKLTKGQSARITPKRKQQMAERWRQDFQQDIRAWRYFCEVIGSSDFCLGKVAGKDWTIDLGWAVESSEHVAKILEGGFSGGKHPPKPPACDVPGLQQAWDAVLHRFQQKHGKATCRSWLSSATVTSLRGETVTIYCPSAFACQWITQHYLADLTRWWREATVGGAGVTIVELITEERP